MSPTISFRPIVRSISRSACTAPKNFCTASNRTIDIESGTAGAIVFLLLPAADEAAHKAYDIKIGVTGAAWQWAALSRDPRVRVGRNLIEHRCRGAAGLPRFQARRLYSRVMNAVANSGVNKLRTGTATTPEMITPAR